MAMDRETAVKLWREIGLGMPGGGATRRLIEAFATAVEAAERERIAQHFDSRDKGAGGFYDPHEPAEIIRALGPNVKLSGCEAVRSNGS